MAKPNPADLLAQERFEQEKKHYTKTENLLLSVGFLVVLFALLLLFFLLPHAGYSKTENRELSAFPAFSAKALFGSEFLKTETADIDAGGDFTGNVETYISDHFPLKDVFVEIHAIYELGQGKMSSSGVIAGRGGYLLSEQKSATDRQKATLSRYEKAIRLLSEQVPTVAAVTESGSQMLTDRLPFFFSTASVEKNRALVRETFSGEKPYEYLDLTQVLAGRSDEAIFYRTDHHWTTLGAFYASQAALTSLGADPDVADPETFVEVTNGFCGTLYNRSGMFWHHGDPIEIFINDEKSYSVSFCDAAGNVQRTGGQLYDLSCLEEGYRGTEYDLFVAPVSTPVVKISLPGEQRQTLLVLKDSFAHSALPFLAERYDLITVDIRQNLDYARILVEQGSVDAMLVLVSEDTLFG